MQVYGNLEEVRKAINGHFDRLIKEREKDRDNQVNLLSKQFNQSLEELRAEKRRERENAVRKVKAKALNERKAAAKRDFEKAREDMINSVLQALEQKLPKIAKSKEYRAFVKKHAPKGKFTLKKGQLGVKYESNTVVLDFDLRSLFESKQGRLREIVTKELFGE